MSKDPTCNTPLCLDYVVYCGVRLVKVNLSCTYNMALVWNTFHHSVYGATGSALASTLALPPALIDGPCSGVRTRASSGRDTQEFAEAQTVVFGKLPRDLTRYIRKYLQTRLSCKFTWNPPTTSFDRSQWSTAQNRACVVVPPQNNDRGW